MVPSITWKVSMHRSKFLTGILNGGKYNKRESFKAIYCSGVWHMLFKDALASSLLAVSMCYHMRIQNPKRAHIIIVIYSFLCCHINF